MTQKEWNTIERAISGLSTLEKRKLVDRLNKSIAEDEHAKHGCDEMTADQKQAIVKLLDKIKNMPAEDDPYAHLGYTNESHDRILYDLEQK